LAALDPLEYAKYLNDNKADAIAADNLLGYLLPSFTGYSSMNDVVPTGLYVNCHYGSTPYNNTGSKSASAKEYIDAVQYAVGDNYQPVTEKLPKDDYNQSWALGLNFLGRRVPPSLCPINPRPSLAQLHASYSWQIRDATAHAAKTLPLSPPSLSNLLPAKQSALREWYSEPK
jgi:hypothetical protein